MTKSFYFKLEIIKSDSALIAFRILKQPKSVTGCGIILMEPTLKICSSSFPEVRLVNVCGKGNIGLYSSYYVSPTEIELNWYWVKYEFLKQYSKSNSIYFYLQGYYNFSDDKPVLLPANRFKEIHMKLLNACIEHRYKKYKEAVKQNDIKKWYI